MDAPSLDWSVSAVDTSLLRALNAVSARLPRWTIEDSAAVLQGKDLGAPRA